MPIGQPLTNRIRRFFGSLRLSPHSFLPVPHFTSTSWTERRHFPTNFTESLNAVPHSTHGSRFIWTESIERAARSTQDEGARYGVVHCVRARGLARSITCIMWVTIRTIPFWGAPCFRAWRHHALLPLSPLSNVKEWSHTFDSFFLSPSSTSFSGCYFLFRNWTYDNEVSGPIVHISVFRKIKVIQEESKSFCLHSFFPVSFYPVHRRINCVMDIHALRAGIHGSPVLRACFMVGLECK